jgi:hypothetical protein
MKLREKMVIYLAVGKSVDTHRLEIFRQSLGDMSLGLLELAMQ